MLLPIILMMVSINTIAQTTGIKFETGLKWTEIQAKAKAENKYIFIDCYATWCGPCKWMTKNIFPQKEVGEYFNSHFISVAVQMDRTREDPREVQDWYADADIIKYKYDVSSYPNYLFFSPEGQAVHRFVGTTKDGAEFIAKAGDALNPDRQYFTVMNKWKEYPRDSAFLQKALTMSLENNDEKSAEVIGDTYIDCLKAPFEKNNILLISEFIYSTKDKGFNFFLNNVLKIDSVIGKKGYVEGKLTDVIYKEEINPLFKQEKFPLTWNVISTRLKSIYPTMGGQFVQTAKGYFSQDIDEKIKTELNNKHVTQLADGNKIYKEFKNKFPGFDIDRLFLHAEVDYFAGKKLWRECQTACLLLLKQYGNQLGRYSVNNLAWKYAFLHFSDKATLLETLKAIKYYIDSAPYDSNSANYIDTYANIHYKLGNAKEAILWETKAIELAEKYKSVYPDDPAEFAKNKEKMEKGQKTWPDETHT